MSTLALAKPSDSWWRPLWGGMPEFVQESAQPFRTFDVRFRSPEDAAAFRELTETRFYHETDNKAQLSGWTWYPDGGYGRYRDRAWVGGDGPRHPVYVISKGRWESRLTVRYLERMGVPYRVVVEPQEWNQYASVIDPKKILTLPFSNLGLGSIPARNWVWEHAIASGAERHWILDDNIWGVYRLLRNEKRLTITGAPMRAAEDWADRYENVAIAGFQYEFFVHRREVYAPVALNTRVYSWILIRNDLPYRWRGRYNEDTDLSLCALRDGWVTALFNAFLAKKEPTMRRKGGNTDELYAGEGRLRMAQELRRLHPDVVKVSRKWGRVQHVVDYTPFKRNALRLRPGVSIPEAPDEYGMTLEDV